MNTDKLLERSEIDDGYKWRVQDIYADDNLWEKDFEKVKNAIDLLASFKGKISESGESLLEFLKRTDEVSQLLEKMIVYAIMRRDEDTRESFYQKMYDRCGSLFTDINAALAFFEPELLAMDKEKIDAFFENTEGLSLYSLR